MNRRRLRQWAKVFRNTPALSSSGVQADAFAALPEQVRVHLTRKAASTTVVLAGVMMEVDAIIFVEPDADVRPRQANELNDILKIDTQYWFVEGVVDDNTDKKRFSKAFVNERGKVAG